MSTPDRIALHTRDVAFDRGTCHVPLVSGRTVDDPAGPGRTALCVARAAGDRVVAEPPR